MTTTTTTTSTTSGPSPEEQLRAENAELRARLEEAEETLHAIRSGEVDALVVETDEGPQIFSLDTALAASNRFRGEILAQVGDAVIAVDADQRVTYLNAAAERQYRVSASDVLGRQLSEIFSRQWPSAGAQAALEVALREHGEWHGELTHRAHDAREIAVETSITALREASGVVAGHVSAIRDITERKRNTDELQSVNRLLDALLHTAPVGFCFLDRDLRFVRINERLALINGIPAEAHLGRHVSEILPTLVERLRSVTSRILATGQPVMDREFSGETPAAPGEMRFWSESWYPLHDGAGEVLGFGGIVEEITARKRAEEQLVKMNENLLVASMRQHELTEKAQWLTVQLQTDLTARTAAEQALRESHHFIHSVLYNLFAFVGVMTVDGILTDANRSSLEAAGIPASEVLGKKFWDCYWWSYSPEIQAQLRAACERAASGEVVRYDVPVRMAGNTRMWIDFQLSPLRDTEGRITHLIPSAMDIAVRHAAEESQRASEERFRAAVDAVSDIVWTNTPEGKMEGEQPGWGAFTGQRREEYEGFGWSDAVHPDDTRATMDAWNLAVAQTRTYEFEHRVRRHDGLWRVCSTRATPVVDPKGRVREWVGVHTDITERKRAEEALQESEAHQREARAEAEAANRSKDNFLATLSHELRTPLNAILGWAVLLRTTPTEDGMPDLDDIEQGLAVIERNARLQGQLIEDVLDVARITSGKFMLDTRPLDLMDLVLAAVDAVRPAAEGKGLTLELASGGEGRGEGRGEGDGQGGGADGLGSLWVDADSSRLQQAVSNLLTNAVKFTPKGGRVGVGVGFVKGTGGGTARITVTDTGRGIKEEFLSVIFERFKQAGEGTTRSHGGLGLGLAVVRHIIEAHGGTARAMSEGEGKGAIFTLELPAMPQSAVPDQSGTAVLTVNLPRLDGLRVLVVDDEEDSRVMAERALRAAGAIVVLAASAEEGYRLAISGQGGAGGQPGAGGEGGAAELQFIVSDIGMPGEDGYSMIQRVRTHRGGKDLPAVAMTAFAAPEDKRRALMAGFQAHMAKPIDPHDLIAVVAGLIDGAGRRG